jgi:hydrogenase maturation protein HypF
MVKKLSIVDSSPRFDTVVLTGGVFQNRLLLQLTRDLLQVHGFTVLTPARIPANDGGIALGQALIASAKSLERK